MLRIIQFPHPIWEEDANNIINGVKRWNTGPHKRNFLCSAGKAITAMGGTPQRFDSISFWGEWEPEARVVKNFNQAQSPIEPQRLIKPLFPEQMPAPHGEECCGNTDPFVFGEHFKYSNCRQRNKKGMVKIMQTLSAGSLILFGGIHQGAFWLDTVFVTSRNAHQFVANQYEQGLQGVLKLDGDDADFKAATLEPLALQAGNSAFTLYQGQTYWENHDYFSFVPCDVNKNAFQKVKLTPDIVPGLSANARNYTVLGKPETDGSDPRKIWRAIADYVLSQGLSLGVRFDNVA